MNFRYPSLSEILILYKKVISQSGGTQGVRDIGLLESSISQPRISFDGQDLYPSIIEKATILCFSLVKNHPFIDGNKRIGHAAMETFLILNGYEISANFEVQESIILKLANGEISKEEFVDWVKRNIVGIKI
ncbi:MAG: type II toxin-antitoxin system death-on-curing family toxin [Spirochaetia bacterium]|nr:type II toxin-antitoxin system death-on-curing family toxin [Spirochaetia bacterium]